MHTTITPVVQGNVNKVELLLESMSTLLLVSV